MRTLTIISIILIISFINSSGVGNSCGGEASSLKDCKDLELDPEDKYCCYISFKESGQAYDECIPLTEAQYKDQDGFKETLKTDYKQTVTKLKCDSNYLKFYFLSLFLVLLL